KTAEIRSQVALLHEATTPVSSTSTADRTDNIRTAFSRINGQIVEPGGKLSFNKVTLDRTLKNGYKYAIEYELGREKIGVGGGVCQASTTLYLVALQSNLEIVSRISHSDPVSYTIFGQDATVVYGRHDLVIKNTSSGNIYITAHVREIKKNKYQCEVRIYGPSLGDGISYSLRTETVETIPAPLVDTYEKDTDHTYVTYKDEEPYLVRKARDGMINETYLQMWQYDTLVSEKFVSRDTCKERSNLYLTGTLNRP
ncbi:MAG: VanW family protein, partial [Clostridia bacterium]|nr:VanW family protein [Clostridia bacterium]